MKFLLHKTSALVVALSILVVFLVACEQSSPAKKIPVPPVNDPVGTYLLTVSGNGAAAMSNGASDKTAYNAPRGIAVDNNLNLYIADSKNQQIRYARNSNTNYVKKFYSNVSFPLYTSSSYAGRPDTSSGSTNGAGVNGTAFFEPSALAYFKKNSVNLGKNCFAASGGAATDCLFIADTKNNKIRVMETGDTFKVDDFVGSGVAGFIDGVGTAAAFRAPRGVAVNQKTGDLYIADSENNAIRKVVFATKTVSTLAGSNTDINGGDIDGGTAGTTKVRSPQGVALNAAGALFVADSGNSKIRRIIETPYSAKTLSITGDATLDFPVGIAFDSKDRLFIVDQGSWKVLYCTISGDTCNVKVLAGLGQPFTRDATTGNDATSYGAFSQPSSLAVSPDGNLVFVTDSVSNLIRLIKVVPPK